MRSQNAETCNIKGYTYSVLGASVLSVSQIIQGSDRSQLNWELKVNR